MLLELGFGSQGLQPVARHGFSCFVLKESLSLGKGCQGRWSMEEGFEPLKWDLGEGGGRFLLRTVIGDLYKVKYRT